MQRKADRDGAIDEMLSATLRAEAARAAVSDDCIDAETIAAWSDRTLPAASAARVETHLSRCSHCQALLAALVRSAPPATAPSRSIWQRWQLRWVVPIAAAASALALWVAIPSDRREVTPQVAVLDDSRQSVPASPGQPSGVAEQERNEVSSNLEKRSDQQQRRPAAQNAPSSTADSAAAGTPPARERSAAAAESLQEKADTPAPAPAAPPALRRELSAEQQTPATLEALSPDPANRWRIRLRQGFGGQVASGIRVERSTDAGASWEAVPFPESIDLTGVRALSATSAIVTTADNRQFRTDDAGKTWTPIRD